VPGELATAAPRPSGEAAPQQAAPPLTASAHERFDAAYRSPDTLQTPLTEAEGYPAKTADRAGPPAQLVASPALPLVQQQLEALATQNFVWQGQVWPGQTMRWEIEEEGRHQGADSADGEETANRWRTRLRLTLPSLGEVDAQIRLQGSEITLSLTASSTETQSLLRSATEALRSQLGEAGLALASLGVSPTKESPSYGPPES
jgi:flagellar hook-length control protein FliK